MNCENGCVSDGGEERPVAETLRVLWSLLSWLGGVMVPSLISSEGRLLVSGVGSWLFLPSCSSMEGRRSERRGFLGSTCSP